MFSFSFSSSSFPNFPFYWTRVSAVFSHNVHVNVHLCFYCSALPDVDQRGGAWRSAEASDPRQQEEEDSLYFFLQTWSTLNLFLHVFNSTCVFFCCVLYSVVFIFTCSVVWFLQNPVCSCTFFFYFFQCFFNHGEILKFLIIFEIYPDR